MKVIACTRIIAAAFLLLGLSSVASATDLTFFIGGAIPGKLSLGLASDPTGTLRNLKNGPIFGIRLNKNIVRVIGLENTLAFSTNYLTPKSILNPQNARGFVYNTNLLVNIPIKKFEPYGTAGIGIIYQFGNADTPIGTKLAFNYGGGIKFVRLLGPVGLRFDMRGYRAMRILFVSSKGSLNIFEASAGLIFSFGR
jgi:hypothetical protein